MEIRINGEIESISDDLDIYTGVVRWCSDKIDLKVSSIDVIIVDDKTLRELHKIYLNDDSNTDVMTFNLGDEDEIESEIYISLPRAQEQAEEFHVSFQEEMIRLLIHACLHLAGYDDLNETDRKTMKDQENELVENARIKYINS